MTNAYNEKISQDIEKFETKAIEIGDLPRAISYNWLRNSYKAGNIDADKAVEILLTIHADIPVKEA